MIKSMMKPKYKGYSIEIDLSKFGYKEYIAECTYRFVKKEGKYALSMWLYQKGIDDRMKLSSKKIDTQYISGTRETIEENICRVVHQMCISKSFDYYVERYEYEFSCFEHGNELFETERMNKKNDYKE